ncbi:MAG: PLP-dependent aminotransferase family protein [Caulobacterales bacterium]|nr:PLP-dependent aminotransferase family protein [Caulobacterales bacterium]
MERQQGVGGIAVDWSGLYATRMGKVTASDIRERMKLLADRSIIQLGGGLPDPALFPVAEAAAACARILGDPAQAATALSYARSEGHEPLRAWIAGHMTALGAPCGVDNILITNGSQQGLDFVARLLLSPGDTVAVEMPSFIGALRAFDAYEVRYAALPTAVEAPLPGGAKFGYLGPDFRNPTGTSLSLAERTAVVEKAAAIGLPLLEDGCYEQLWFEGAAAPSVFALAVQAARSVEACGVLHAGSFSKTLAPSLRTGWIAGPSAVIRKLVLIKQAADLATSALNQMLVLELAAGLEAHVVRARALYRRRRDAMLRALEDGMPPGVTWTRPEGGLYIWLTLPPGLDGAAVAERALMEDQVSVISGAAFYPVEPRRNTLRLSYSLASEADAAEGVRRLGRRIEAMMALA